MTVTTWQLDKQLLLTSDEPRKPNKKGDLQVLVAPPPAQDDHKRRWATDLSPLHDAVRFGDPGTGNWEQVEDHRKDKLWVAHGKPYTLDEDQDGQSYDGLGPVPAWLHADEPPLPLEDAKTNKRAQITAACLAAIFSGFEYDGHMYDSDDQSRQNIIGTATAVANGVALPQGFTWRTADNQDIPMDGPGVIALGAALLAHTQAQYSTSWALKAQIDAAQDNATVEQITWPT